MRQLNFVKVKQEQQLSNSKDRALHLRARGQKSSKKMCLEVVRPPSSYLAAKKGKLQLFSSRLCKPSSTTFKNPKCTINLSAAEAKVRAQSASQKKPTS